MPRVPKKEETIAQWIRLPETVHASIADAPGSILLETFRFDSSNKFSYLFLNPVSVISSDALDDIPHVFSRIEEALASGFHVAGFLSYECGYHFQQLCGGNSMLQGFPLAWFGVYETPLIFDHSRGCFKGADLTPLLQMSPQKDTNAVLDQLTLGIPKGAYLANIEKIKEYIAAGDTYQVNFTDSVSFQTDSSASTVFEVLSKHQSVAYGAFMNVAGHHILSLSPELFFRIDENRIVTRPMKGTMPRGLDSPEDAQAIIRLQNDEKNRSEHVMIVDLLRNDLGRICTTGSIRVEDLFSVEKYETLLQMTSTVSGTLRPEVLYYDIFQSMFPSGSITGAPKIRTMQIIQELERNPRGIYTGAIGFISPNRSAVFNVAIRTLVMKDGGIQMGVGGGVVADSDPEDEHRECLLKASFLTRGHHNFQLIETMLWDKEYYLLPLHLERLESSASYFNFNFNRKVIHSQLQEMSTSFTTGERYKVRLLLNSSGKITLTSLILGDGPCTGNVKMSSECTSSMNVFLRHKNTRREMYDRQYAEAQAMGFDEVIFTNEKGEVTEGAISNIFIEQSGKLITPPITCGVLPGIMRRHLLETCATAEERVLTIKDLKDADAVLLCNSVRGIRRVNAIYSDVSISSSILE